MDELLAALRASAEPTRLRILALCLKGELTVSELVRILGQSQPRISRHLKLLSEAGLLERSREGNWVFYRLAVGGVGADLSQHLSLLLPADDELLNRDQNRLAEVRRDRAEAASEYFRENAARWDHIRKLNVDEEAVERLILSLLPPDKVSSLIDIGTGTGRMLELYAPHIERGEGVDLSHDMLSVARANLDRAAVGNCRVRQGNMYQLPFAANSFGAAVIHQVMHFADDQPLAVSEAARVLKPGGRLLIVDLQSHDLQSLRDEHEHRRLGFDDAEVAGWFIHAYLEPDATEHLAGDPLTVSLWRARKPETAALDKGRSRSTMPEARSAH